jgi:alcohol dehydrogenase
MKAVVFEDVGRLVIREVPEPTIEEPRDAIVRITAAGICGSDLHFLHGKAPLTPGDTIGHEGVGVIEEIGSEVRHFRPGDRVVIAFDIVCGECWYCRNGQTALCEHFQMLGGGAFGGNLVGAQAEKVRVPSADVNLLSVPEGMEDERALFVGDILTTGYYGTAIAGIGPEDSVAVVGAGPVGFFCIQAAQVHGARQVLALDRLPDRLLLAEKVGAIPINVDERNPQIAVSDLTEGRGADVVIEAVGHPSSYETALDVVRGGGTVSVVGVFVSERIEVPMGVYWARALRVLFAGMCPIHAWWERSMESVRTGAIDPLPIISHVLPLAEAVHGYELFDSRQATKVVLKP